MAVSAVPYYNAEGLNVAGTASMSKVNNLFIAAETRLRLLFSLAKGFFAVPTATLDAGNDKVDLTAISAILDGYYLSGTGAWQFAAEGDDTYCLQVENDGTLTINTDAAEDATLLTVATVDRASGVLSNLTITGEIGISFTGGTGDTLMIGAAATGELMMKDAAAKTIEPSGVMAADAASAVTLKHTELHDSEDHTALAENAAGHSGLDFAYKAGKIRLDNSVVSVIAGTVTLADDTTNYIEVDNAGAVTDNTTGFTAGSIPLFTVVTASGAIDTVTDQRVWLVIATDPGAAGDVTGPGSSTDGYIVVFNGVTGKVIKQYALSAAAISTAISDLATVVAAEAAHEADTANPHGVTAAQVGNGTAQWNANKISGDTLDTAAKAVGYLLGWDGANVVYLAPGAVDIAGQTVTTAVDHANDYAIIHDDSEGGIRKITLGNLFQNLSAAANAPNLLDNPEFAIDQRGGGASRTSTDDTYGLDRWLTLCEGNATIERIASGLNTASYAARLTTPALNRYGGLAQIVESVKSLPYRGRTMELQARVRCASAVTVRWAILEWTGTADSPTSDVVNDWTSGTFTTGNFFMAANMAVVATGTQEVSANTWTAIAGNGAVSTSCNNLIVMIWSDYADSNATLDITECDLFAGSATRTWAPKDPAADEQECLRHAFVFQSTRASGYRQGTTQVASFYDIFTIPMRTAPSVSHNISAWNNGWPPATTTVAMYNSVTATYATITGGLTVNAFAVDRFKWGITFTAATSFNGNAGDVGAVGFGGDVRLVFTADL